MLHVAQNSLRNSIFANELTIGTVALKKIDNKIQFDGIVLDRFGTEIGSGDAIIGDIVALENTVDNHEIRISENETDIQTIVGIVDTKQNAQQFTDYTIQTNASITNINGDITTINSDITTINGEITTIKLDATALTGVVQNNTADILLLENLTTSHGTDISANTADILVNANSITDIGLQFSNYYTQTQSNTLFVPQNTHNAHVLLHDDLRGDHDAHVMSTSNTFALKADLNATYSNLEVDALIANFLSSTQINNLLNGKVDNIYLTNNYTLATEINTLLNAKTDNIDFNLLSSTVADNSNAIGVLQTDTGVNSNNIDNIQLWKGTAETRISSIELWRPTVDTSISNLETDLSNRLLTTTYNSYISANNTNITNLQNADVSLQSQIDNIVSGEIDAYSKIETDDLLATKTNSTSFNSLESSYTTFKNTTVPNTYYTKTYLDSDTTGKLDKSVYNTYTGNNNTDISNLQTGQADRYTKFEIDQQISPIETDVSNLKWKTNNSMYVITEVDTLLNDKSDKLTTYTKTEIDNNHYSKNYLDSDTTGKVDKSVYNTYTGTNDTDISNLQTGQADRYTKLEIHYRVSPIETDVSNLKWKTNNSMYVITEVDTLLNDKSDKLTTYTKTEIDNNIYTRTQSDTLLNDKADSSNVYSKLESDDLLAYKANLQNVYSINATNILLNDKADSSNIYSKLESDDLLADKVDNTTYDARVTDVDTALNNKAQSFTAMFPMQYSGNIVSISEAFLYGMMRAPRTALNFKLNLQIGSNYSPGSLNVWTFEVGSTTYCTRVCMDISSTSYIHNTACSNFMLNRTTSTRYLSYVDNNNSMCELTSYTFSASNGYSSNYQEYRFRFNPATITDEVLQYGFTNQASSSKTVWATITANITVVNYNYDMRFTSLFCLYWTKHTGFTETLPTINSIGDDRYSITDKKQYIGGYTMPPNSFTEHTPHHFTITKRMRVPANTAYYKIQPVVWSDYTASSIQKIHILATDVQIALEPYID